MKVKTIIKTCGACPSQWEGHLEDGRMFYARYRWGALGISLSEYPTDDVFIAMDNNIYNEQLSDGLDGVLDEDELKTEMEKLGFKFN